ncbi:hypothetical protein MMC22_001759 [Lobaria immixta]|nr:hypothetical protein [Lobaria immixta]
MSFPKKRSYSDMQDFDKAFSHHHTHSITHRFDQESNVNHNNTYAMMVLRLAAGCTEKDMDQQFLRMAVDLGINIPQSPKTTLELVTSNVSALNLTSDEHEEHPSLSRISQSSHPTSDCSSELKQPTAASSVTTASIASNSPSIASTSSRKSSYEKIKRGIRRISILRRRRAIDAPVPALPFPSSAFHTLRPLAQKRALTSNPFSTSKNSYSATSEPLPTTPPDTPPSFSTSAPLILTRQPTARPCSPSPSEEEETSSALAALHRSLQNPRLKALRAEQLQEQGRFIRYEALQHHLIRLSQVSAKRTLLAHQTSRTQSLKSRHAEALSSLEQRHLCAEVDLHEKLQLEKRGCDTRLRHMQAYCNPSSSVKGMPGRTVTRSDHRQLEQQRHVRNGMDNLHTARINVLREKQSKQLERVAAKQEAEMEVLSESHVEEVAELEKRFEGEEQQLGEEIRERRQKLVRRWGLAEAIERRKLENSGAGDFGPLPDVEWGGDVAIGVERDSEEKESEMENGMMESVDKAFTHEAMRAYDAATFGTA